MKIIKTLLILLIIVISVSFLFENTWIVEQKYEIHYYTYTSPPIPMVLLLLGSILLGALLITIPSFMKGHKLKKIVKMERKKIAQMEKELSSLRNLPITEEKKIEQINKES